MRRFALGVCAVVFGAAALSAAEAGKPPEEAATPKGLEDVPAVVAQVFGHPITREELIRELVGSSRQEAFERIARRVLVELRAKEMGISVTEEELEAQLRRDEAGIGNDFMRFAEDDRRPMWDVTPKTFEEIVRARYQMSLGEYRDQIIRQRLLVRKIVGRRIRPTLAELRQFFARFEDQFQPQKRYLASHILITPYQMGNLMRKDWFTQGTRDKDKLAEERRERLKWYRDHGVKIVEGLENVDIGKLEVGGQDDQAALRAKLDNTPESWALDLSPEWQRAKKDAELVLAKLKSGKVSWDDAVRTFSMDPHDRPDKKTGKSFRDLLIPKVGPGVVGWYDKLGPMVDEFYQATKELKPAGKESDGLCAQPIRTRFGYHIVKMLEVTEGKKRTFDEAREDVERTYVSWTTWNLSDMWLEDQVARAGKEVELTGASLVVPPKNVKEAPGTDPVIAKIGDMPVLRSQLWRELLKVEAFEALDRLINREVALGPLKKMGPDRLEWLGGAHNALAPAGEGPPFEPISITKADVDKALVPDLLEVDRINAARKKKDPNAPPMKLDEYLMWRFGSTVDEHRRVLEASVVLEKAVLRKLEPEKRHYMATLRMNYEMVKEKHYREPVSFRFEHAMVFVPPEAGQQGMQGAVNVAEDWLAEYREKKVTWEQIRDQARAMPNYPERLKDTQDYHGKNGPYPEIYEVAVRENWEKDQVHGPVVAHDGVHLLKVEAKRSARIPDFDDVIDRVTADYLSARSMMLMDVWLRPIRYGDEIKRFAYKQETIDEVMDFVPLGGR
ncbi:MAG: hypothetical protein L6R28_20635 [Planctomycetes bacterium]|nr:hypothetical protein [Planctomycetota bacterium]